MRVHTSGTGGSPLRRIAIWILVGVVAVGVGLASGPVWGWSNAWNIVSITAAIWVGTPLVVLAFAKQRFESHETSQRTTSGHLNGERPGAKYETHEAPGKHTNLDEISSISGIGRKAGISQAEDFEDLVLLGDRLPHVIHSVKSIRQIGTQASIPSGILADEEVSAERLWPDLLIAALERGKLPLLLNRIEKKIENRVDVWEVRTLIRRILDQQAEL